MTPARMICAAVLLWALCGGCQYVESDPLLSSNPPPMKLGQPPASKD